MGRCAMRWAKIWSDVLYCGAMGDTMELCAMRWCDLRSDETVQSEAVVRMPMTKMKLNIISC